MIIKVAGEFPCGVSGFDEFFCRDGRAALGAFVAGFVGAEVITTVFAEAGKSYSTRLLEFDD